MSASPRLASAPAPPTAPTPSSHARTLCAAPCRVEPPHAPPRPHPRPSRAAAAPPHHRSHSHYLYLYPPSVRVSGTRAAVIYRIIAFVLSVHLSGFYVLPPPPPPRSSPPSLPPLHRHHLPSSRSFGLRVFNSGSPSSSHLPTLLVTVIHRISPHPAPHAYAYSLPPTSYAYAYLHHTPRRPTAIALPHHCMSHPTRSPRLCPAWPRALLRLFFLFLCVPFGRVEALARVCSHSSKPHMLLRLDTMILDSTRRSVRYRCQPPCASLCSARPGLFISSPTHRSTN